MSEVKRNSDYLLHCSDQEPKKALSDHREEKIDTSACSVVKMKEQEATTIALENSYEQKKSELNEMKARAEKYAEDHYKLFRDQRFQQLKSDFDTMKSRAEKADSENIELKEKNYLYLSMLDDERINSKKNCLNFESELAAKTAAVEELVSISQRAMRQWHMHMTDLQQEDLDELLKDENNHEAHDYKKLFELITKHAKGEWVSELEEVSLRMKINELKNQIRIYEENDNEKIISLLKENKALRCALEKYKGVKMLIEVESGFPEIKATTFVDIATETLKQLTQTGGKGSESLDDFEHDSGGFDVK